MKIKGKIRLGVGILFLMVLALSVVSTKYINDLKKDTDNILVANYNSIKYSQEMLSALDEIPTDASAVSIFEASLDKQQGNVTEIGESALTKELAEHFERLKSNTGDGNIYKTIRSDLSSIVAINMESIQRKSDIAKVTAEQATFWIIATGTICFILAFSLLFNLPNMIADPIKVLTVSIKEIAAENYTQRVNIESEDEFGEVAVAFNTMAKKLEEYNSSNLYKLLLEKKRIETLINKMKDPVIGLDENNIILFVNDEGYKVIGLPVSELIGKHAQDVSLKNDLMRSLMNEVVAPSKLYMENKSMKIYANNKESYFEKEIIPINITPTGEENQVHIGHVILLKNITPFKELDFAKTNFIANVSHELKTPISSIKMSLRLLESENKESITEGQKNLMDSINDDTNRLLKITGQLLDISQVESGNIQLNIQSGDPLQILQYALDAVKTTADHKGIELFVVKEQNLSNIKSDIEKTTWVLINFLTNAIRYSPERNKITITVKQEIDGVIFSVKDEGKGIDERYREKIFERYFQVPGSNKTGTGLGLAISKEFIEAQSGEIGVKSEIGMGSTFYFKLKRA